MNLIQNTAQSDLVFSRARRRLNWKIRWLAEKKHRSLWELDTLSLPRALRPYRVKVRRFAREVLFPRALDGDRHNANAIQNEVLEAAGKAGLLSDLLPPPLGSVPYRIYRHGLVLLHSVKMEELCAACGGLGLLIGAHGLGTMPVILGGGLGQIGRHILPAYRSNQRGEPCLMAFAITEPAGGSDVEDTAGAAQYTPGTVARRVRGGWALTGRKIFISGGDLARYVTIFAALEGEGMESWTCFLVEKGMDGFQVGRNELKMGQRASSATELILDNVFVPDKNVVGALRAGWAINRTTLNISRIPVGAIALGIARGAWEAADTFARRTELRGKRLIDYQDVQLALADMMTELAAARALIWQAAASWSPNQARASMAKVFGSDAAMRICTRAMDLLGNHGFLHHQRVEKHFRDARLTQIYEGTNQINRLAIMEDQFDLPAVENR